MDAFNKKKKVLCPIEGKDGKKYWRWLGMAWVNKDSSINVYLDSLPMNGQLQIRDWDERDDRRREPQQGLDLPGPSAAQPASPPDADIPF